MHVIAGLGLGGAEGMLRSLVTCGRPERPEQVVVDLLADGEHATSIRAAGVRVHELGMGRGRPSLLALARLARLIRAGRPDVVQSWMYHADLAASLALMLSGRRRATRHYWGIRCSNMESENHGPLFGVVRSATRRMSGWPDAVVANSEAGREFHRAMGFRPRAFLLIPNGIDTDVFRPDPIARRRVRATLGISERAFVVLTVARSDPMKDHATLAAALTRIPGDVHWLCAGNGTEALKPQPGLHLMGPRMDVPSLYAAADIYAQTSAYGEGFPTVLAEGMAAGLAPVATGVGDAATIIGDTGVVIPPRDPESLAFAIAALVADRTRLQANGNAARAHIVARFSLDRAVAAFDRLHRNGTMSFAERPESLSSSASTSPRSRRA